MIEDILDKAKWFYIPYQPYKSFYHLIVENDDEDWTFYYLENISFAGQIADVSGMMGGLDFLSEKPERARVKTEPPKQTYPVPSEYSEIRKYEIFRLIEQENDRGPYIDRNISGCGIVRKVNGNLGAMIAEFQKILK